MIKLTIHRDTARDKAHNWPWSRTGALQHEDGPGMQEFRVWNETESHMRKRVRPASTSTTLDYHHDNAVLDYHTKSANIKSSCDMNLWEYL